MATRYKLTVTLAAVALSTIFFASCATNPVEKPQPLRLNQITEADRAPALPEYQGKTPGKQEKIARSFEQQPPLIPHKIEGYRIDLKKNRCLECHDRPFYKEENAPKIGDSHYKDRDGKELTHISMARYNCNECHAPQTDAQPLVTNTFQPAK